MATMSSACPLMDKTVGRDHAFQVVKIAVGDKISFFNNGGKILVKICINRFIEHGSAGFVHPLNMRDLIPERCSSGILFGVLIDNRVHGLFHLLLQFLDIPQKSVQFSCFHQLFEPS